MSTIDPRLVLEMDELREKIASELAKRHNWAAQEAFWEHEKRMGRARNYIAVAAIASALTASIIGVLAKIL